MAYCQECGAELSDGVKFCKYCGARQEYLANAPKGFPSDCFSQAEDEFAEGSDEAASFDFEIEDGEVDECKGLDPNRTYHMCFSGRRAEMYDDHGQFIRSFSMSADITQATTTGETVTICTADGATTIFSWTGAFIRRIH